jgi:hypothetical protein
VVLEPSCGGQRPGRPVGWRPCRPVGWWAGGSLVGLQVVAQWACEVEAWQASGPACSSGMGGWQPACSFSVLWHREAFHRLRVQGAEFSALPGALPQPNISPASQQGH